MKRCCWLTDHAPMPEQREYLETRGYEIVHIPSPQPDRWRTAEHAFTTMMRRMGKPDIVVLVMPPAVLGGMFLKMCKGIPVYQPDMRPVAQNQWIWTGHWNLIIGTDYIKKPQEIPVAV